MYSVRVVTCSFRPSLTRFGIVAGLGNSFIVRMLYFCVLILAGNSVSLLKGKLVFKILGFCHIFMIRLLIVIGVQLSYCWIS